jgi:hypothetical protein
MANPTIRIHNSETNQVEDREMTNAEFTAYKAEQADAEAKATEKASIEAARASALAKLAALGLSENEVNGLIS